MSPLLVGVLLFVLGLIVVIGLFRANRGSSPGSGSDTGGSGAPDHGDSNQAANDGGESASGGGGDGGSGGGGAD